MLLELPVRARQPDGRCGVAVVGERLAAVTGAPIRRDRYGVGTLGRTGPGLHERRAERQRNRRETTGRDIEFAHDTLLAACATHARRAAIAVHASATCGGGFEQSRSDARHRCLARAASQQQGTTVRRTRLVGKRRWVRSTRTVHMGPPVVRTRRGRARPRTWPDHDRGCNPGSG